jgi:AraC-like DNA-binding protein
MDRLVYREIAPPPNLSEHVECFWTGHSAAPLLEPRHTRVLPDGCMDIIFDLSRGRARAYVVGAMRSPLLVEQTGKVDMIGVRFRSGAATGALSIPANELTDTSLGLVELWGSAADDISEQLARSAPERRVSLFAREVEKRFRPPPKRDAASAAISLIDRLRGKVTVRQLEEATGVSARHLERRFAERVGLSPKTACRIARFRTALALMSRRPTLRWADLAFSCGYFDQAHLIRDFRAFAGATPEEFRTSRE